MTKRLYYDDPYRTSFTGTVLQCVQHAPGWAVLLDRTAFYPTSGGQPYDTGTLGGFPVRDVWADGAGDVWHLTDCPLDVGAQVAGVIDWPRRFDHMQQHAGEHMLAGAVYHLLGGHTIGLHLGAEVSTIDVELPGGAMRVSEQVLDQLEDTVNAQIQQDLPIRCYFPTPEQLAAAPLRKPPAVKEHIRLVQVGDVECVACGGTHPASAGQVGLVKIVDARPSRGKMRITFLCGMRALKDYQLKARSADRAAALLSAGAGELPGAVSAALDRLRQAQYALHEARLAEALRQVDPLANSAQSIPGGRAVCAVLPGMDREILRELAGCLTARGLIALLASDEGEGAALVFASPNLEWDMGALMTQTLNCLDGKGGGRRDFAQGAGPGGAAIALALYKLTKA